MSHTNQTPNYHLPQFIGTDKPAWLVDFNQSMSEIDTQMKANETASATAEANAQSALSGVTALNSQVGGLQTDVTAIQTQMPLDEAQIATNAQNISTQASAIVNANNRIDTLNGKVGNLANLDTTDKTSIVNAVNEIKGEVNKGSVSVSADGVKTMGALLNELYALIDRTKLTHNSTFRITVSEGNYRYARIDNVSPTFINFVRAYTIATGQSEVNLYSLSANNSAQQVVVTYVNGTITGTDYTSEVKPVGQTFSILY